MFAVILDGATDPCQSGTVRLRSTGFRSLLLALIPLGALPVRAAEAGPVYDVRDYGAKGDGLTVDTRAIQAAIDACGAAPGTVRLHDGVFLSGMIVLKSGVALRIEPSATLLGTRDDAAYPYLSPPTDNSNLHNCRRALVYALGANHLSISGGGTIDGNGGNPKWKGKGNPEANRPMPIFLVQSADVEIHDIQVLNAAMWSVVNMENDRVSIRKVRVHSPDGPTRDGIDILDCHHVTIEDCEIFSQDDSICFKSGSDKGVFDVKVHNVQIQKSSVANGLKLGTASKGSFRHILFDTVVMNDIKQAAMAVESVDGAKVEDIEFRNIEFHQAGAAFYVVLGPRGKSKSIGSVHNLTFSNIRGETALPWGSAISGVQLEGGIYPIDQITFEHVHLKVLGGITKAPPPSPPEYDGGYPDPRIWNLLPAFGYYFRHVHGLRMTDCTSELTAPDGRPEIVREDVTESKP